ncbi:MAG: hypothetical protein ACO1SV_21850 [Fimbriimonas sp.]
MAKRFELEINDAWRWLESNGHQVSDLGRAVATILSRGYQCGIYNVPNVRYTDWSRTDYIELIVFGELSTFDFQNLTRIVIACHDACIRFSVSACNVPSRKDGEGYDYARAMRDDEIEEGWPTGAQLQLLFHARKGRDGSMSSRHPSIEEAIINLRRTSGNDEDTARWESEGGRYVAA